MTNPNHSPQEAPTTTFTNVPALGALATNTLRLVTLGVLARSGNALTSSKVVSEINDALGEGSGHQLPKGANNMIGRYIDELASTDMVMTFEYTQKYVAQITDQGEQLGLPLVGVLAGWQAENTDIPLSRIFGTQSRSGGNSERSTASLRFNVIEGIIDNPSTTMAKIGSTIQETRLRVAQAARSLVQDGVLIENQKARGDYITLDANYLNKYIEKSGRAYTAEKLTAEDVAKYFVEKDVLTVTKDAFLDQALRLDPSLDRGKFWHEILKSTSQDRLKYLKLSDAGNRLDLNPEYEPAIRDLVGKVKRVVDGDSAFTEQARRQAQHIIADTELVNKLVSISRPIQNTNTNSAETSKAQPMRSLPSDSAGSTSTAANSIEDVRVELLRVLNLTDGGMGQESYYDYLKMARFTLEQAIDALGVAYNTAQKIKLPEKEEEQTEKAKLEYTKAQNIIEELGAILRSWQYLIDGPDGIDTKLAATSRLVAGTPANTVSRIESNM